MKVVVVMVIDTGHSGIVEGIVCIIRELTTGTLGDGSGYLYIDIVLVYAKVIWLILSLNPAHFSRNTYIPKYLPKNDCHTLQIFVRSGWGM